MNHNSLKIMTKTTIELTQEQKQILKDERLPHENNYGETVERLCGEADVSFTTEPEVRTIVSDMVIMEALE